MTDRPGMPARHQLRCSDREREGAAERLRAAAVQGRIDLVELDHRMADVYAATTGADLELVIRDLPEPGRAATLLVDDAPTSRFGMAAFGFFARSGRWVVPRVFTALSLWGWGLIDLTEARFTERETHIRAFALFGGLKIVIPDDVEARVRGLGLFGLFGRRGSGSGTPGAPRIVIRGLVLFGVAVTRSGRPGGR
jgi:hypothetical protein